MYNCHLMIAKVSRFLSKNAFREKYVAATYWVIRSQQLDRRDESLVSW